MFIILYIISDCIINWPFLFFYIQIGVIKKVKFTLLSYNIVYKYLSAQFNKMKNCRNSLFLKRTTLQISQHSFTQISEPKNPYKPLIFTHKHNIFLYRYLHLKN